MWKLVNDKMFFQLFEKDELLNECYWEIEFFIWGEKIICMCYIIYENLFKFC